MAFKEEFEAKRVNRSGRNDGGAFRMNEGTCIDAISADMPWPTQMGNAEWQNRRQGQI